VEALLRMRLTAGDAWQLLCPFLGLPVPDEPFPHLNARFRAGATH